MQQQPLPNKEANNKAMPSQRAIMALFHLLDRGRTVNVHGDVPMLAAFACQHHRRSASRATRPYLSACKLGAIEKIDLDGKLCRSSCWQC
jgi:hypothetical protein